MRPDGTDLIQVTNDHKWNGVPSWSPDGTWIIFESARLYTGSLSDRGPTDLYKIHPDGSSIQQLTNDETVQIDPIWSPDGQWIVFSGGKNKQFDIYRIKSDGSQLQQLTYLGNAYYPVWSPDEEWLSFVSIKDSYTFQHYRMHADGNDVKVWEVEIPSSRFSWSPGGDEIAFGYSPDRVGSNINKASLQSLHDKNFQRLTDLPGSNSEPKWSPDGQWLVFTNVKMNTYSQIWKVKATGNDTSQLTNRNCNAWSPSWFSFANDQ
jgi:TolB protein